MSAEVTERVRELARILWDYHVIVAPLDRADFVLAMGSHDERVAVHAAGLIRMDLAPVLVASGGSGKVTGGLWEDSEADRYAAVARALGVTDDQIFVEPSARNTGENITKTRALLRAQGIPAHRGILVAKPYMARRSLHTALQQWPDAHWQVSVPPIAFDSYPSDDVPEVRMINLLVGDLQRMWLYAEQGLQAPADVPESARLAYQELVASGFDEFVIRE